MKLTDEMLVKEFVYLGSFESDRYMIISDPCYEGYTPHLQCMIENAKSGVWHCYTKLVVKEGWGERNACLLALFDGVRLDDSVWVKQSSEEREIGVDSGQAGIYTVNFFHNDEAIKEMPESDFTCGGAFYTKCCRITQGETGAGVLEGGVVSSSGYGDGGYPYSFVKDNGLVTGILIDFCLDRYDEE